MKRLIKCTGPRDKDLTEVTLIIKNLAYQYKEDRKIVEDRARSFEDRQSAYTRIVRARDLLESWTEIRRDIEKKGGAMARKNTNLLVG